ncbi:MAG: hypothetical protein WC277_11950 [Bacilli bacterium]
MVTVTLKKIGVEKAQVTVKGTSTSHIYEATLQQAGRTARWGEVMVIRSPDGSYAAYVGYHHIGYFKGHQPAKDAIKNYLRQRAGRV